MGSSGLHDIWTVYDIDFMINIICVAKVIHLNKILTNQKREFHLLGLSVSFFHQYVRNNLNKSLRFNTFSKENKISTTKMHCDVDNLHSQHRNKVKNRERIINMAHSMKN